MRPFRPPRLRSLRVAVGRAADTTAKEAAKSLCGVIGCSYAHPTWACKHVFTSLCTNRTGGVQCGLPHARSGDRRWTCNQAQAAKSADELRAALLISESRWVAGKPAKLDKYKHALNELG